MVSFFVSNGGCMVKDLEVGDADVLLWFGVASD